MAVVEPSGMGKVVFRVVAVLAVAVFAVGCATGPPRQSRSGPHPGIPNYPGRGRDRLMIHPVAEL